MIPGVAAAGEGVDIFALDFFGFSVSPQCREPIFSSEIKQSIIIPAKFIFQMHTLLPCTEGNPDQARENSNADMDNPGHRKRRCAGQVQG